MFIVINKDGSIATIAPSNVYQGSNEAAVLGIFAPFSVSSFPLIAVNVELPNGKLENPLTASPASEQPEGFGAWTLPLPSTITALSGTVRMSFVFAGSKGQRFPTEAAEINVTATVPLTPPDSPDTTTYDKLLEAISSISDSMRANWTQNDQNGLGYIQNKPAINSGYLTEASGNFSAALGDQTKASGNASFASGYKSEAVGVSSAAFGSECLANTFASFVAGNLLKALGLASTVFGEGSETAEEADVACAIGYHIKAMFPHVFACGRYNDTTSEAVFQVGYGQDENSRKNVFEVFNDGRIKCSRLDMFNSSEAGNFVVIGSDGELVTASIPVGGAY